MKRIRLLREGQPVRQPAAHGTDGGTVNIQVGTDRRGRYHQVTSLPVARNTHTKIRRP